MAQPYELLTVEARQSERATRARKREAWPQSTELQRLLARAAASNEQLFQGLEDLVVETLAATLGEETERWRAGVRTAVKRAREQALQLELGVRGGEEAIETVIETKDVVEGMTEEEAKRWRAFLKTKAGGGKVKGGKAKPAATATSGGGASCGIGRAGAEHRTGEAGRRRRCSSFHNISCHSFCSFRSSSSNTISRQGAGTMQMQRGREAWAGGAGYNAGQSKAQQAAGGWGGLSTVD
jgi:hypothetical protein